MISRRQIEVKIYVVEKTLQDVDIDQARKNQRQDSLKKGNALLCVLPDHPFLVCTAQLLTQ